MNFTPGCDLNHSHSGFSEPSIGTVVVVSIRSKLVALLLLFGLLAGPAAAISHCWRTPSSSSEHCVPHCPMTAQKGLAGSSVFQALPPTATCCRISPSRPAPVSQLVAPADGSRVATATVQITTPLAVLPVVVRASDAAPPPPIAPSQAVLCTFLI
jgi:hypothetical protein